MNVIVTNLIIISKVKKGEKLITRNEFLNIDTRTFQFFFRWKEAEGRAVLLERLYTTTEEGINCKLFSNLKQCIAGLLNLQATYDYDIQTVSRIQVIIDRITFALEKNNTEII